MRRRVVAIGSVVWAVLGAAIAMPSIPNVNDDAKVLVGVCSVLFPLCAVGAALALHRRRDRLAGALLLASVATPTYFAYALNLGALVVGAVLVVAPTVLLGDRRSPAPTSSRSRREAGV